VTDVEQVTKGLWKKYGDGRVKDTPITEVCSYNAIVIINWTTHIFQIFPAWLWMILSFLSALSVHYHAMLRRVWFCHSIRTVNRGQLVTRHIFAETCICKNQGLKSVGRTAALRGTPCDSTASCFPLSL